MTVRLALLLLSLVIAEQAAFAAPVPRTGTMHLKVAAYPGTPTQFTGYYATGTVIVDPDAGLLRIPAGVIDFNRPIVIPISGTTGVGVRIGSMRNLTGEFRVGGAVTQAPGEVCNLTAPPNDTACVAGFGVGGIMPLAGQISLYFGSPGNRYPINRTVTPIGVGGGVTNLPFTFDVAPWTVGEGRAYAGDEPQISLGSVDAAQGVFTIVTPTYLRLGSLSQGSLGPVFGFQIHFTDGLTFPSFLSSVDTSDRDRDGLENDQDNCPDDPNPGQEDADGDGVGDPRDNCLGSANADQADRDGDTYGDACDNCAGKSNLDQADADGDGRGDVCDIQCSDGIDNDGDLKKDYPSDPGCAASSSETESPECNDGIDNDGDGAVDLTDIGCHDAAWPTENPPCSDGKNNDPQEDDLIDFDGGASAGVSPELQTAPDPQCQGDPSRLQEAKPKKCGLGAEVLVVLTLVGWRINRRRRRAA